MSYSVQSSVPDSVIYDNSSDDISSIGTPNHLQEPPSIDHHDDHDDHTEASAESRRRNANMYKEALRGAPITTPTPTPKAKAKAKAKDIKHLSTEQAEEKLKNLTLKHEGDMSKKDGQNADELNHLFDELRRFLTRSS